MKRLLHLTSSPFYGGPERQMLELANTLRDRGRPVETVFGSFSENGNAREFLTLTERAGYRSIELKSDMPHLVGAKRELTDLLRCEKIDLVFLHGHKARTVGWFAARKASVPMIGVSRGWTTENWKIAVYTKIDRWMHRRMDHVVCVSQGQADKVVRYGTPKSRVSVIRNAIRTDRFDTAPDPDYRRKLESFFPEAPRFLLGDAGRLSPEKGFDVFLESLALLKQYGLSVGLVIFGEGFLLEPLREQAEKLGIARSVAFPGFTRELDRFMPHFDIFVQSSHTEGLPNVLLEAMAARTAVVATEVGGTAEVVEEGVTGLRVPPADPEKLAGAIRRVLEDDTLRDTMGREGRKRVEEHFTFAAQSDAYWALIERFAS